MSDHSHSAPVAQLPTSFLGYLKSTGPGLVVVLTWLGAGDIVDMGVAGGKLRLLTDVGARTGGGHAVLVCLADCQVSTLQFSW